MEASTTNGANLRSLSEVLKEFLESINIMYTPEGMSASAFDHNTIALINFHIPKDAFDRYLCQGNFVACLNMNVLHNTLKAVGATRSALTQRIDPKHPDVMQVKICNAETRTTSTSTLKLWGFSADHLEIPNSVFPYYIEMPAAYLQRHINYLCTLMNNENNNKRIEVVVDSTGRFDLSVEGEFGCTRIEIGQAEAGVKVHLGPVDPMHEDFGVPTQDEEIVYDEGSDDDEEEGEEAEEDDGAVAGSKRKRGAQGGRKKAAKKTKRAGFVVPQDRGQVLDEAVAEVEQERENVRQPPVKEYYNIKYFKSIAKAASLSATVLIFIRPNYPIVFLYRIGTMGKVCFCLSPAIAGTAAGAKEVDKDDEQAGDDDDEEIVEGEEEANADGQAEIYYDDEDDGTAAAATQQPSNDDDMMDEEEPQDIEQQEDYEEDIVPEE